MTREEFEARFAQLERDCISIAGLRRDSKLHPVWSRFRSARSRFDAGEVPEAIARLSYVKLMLEDLSRIGAHDDSLFRHFRRAVSRQMPVANYYGLRQEIQTARWLIERAIPFKKAETPDFLVPEVGGQIGIECTSCHLSERVVPGKVDLTYKLVAAIAKKSKGAYGTDRLLLEVDVSNVLFHEHSSAARKVLSSKPALIEALQADVDASVFSSVVAQYYSWVVQSNELSLSHHWVRIDRTEMQPSFAAFLDRFRPKGDNWVLGRVNSQV